MITLETLNNVIDKLYWYEINNDAKTNVKTEILVRAKESKIAYGHLRVLVAPLKGRGQFWVDIKNLREHIDIGDN